MDSKRFEQWSREELIDYVTKLEKTLKEESNDFLGNFKWAGNLGQWFWYYQDNKVIFNDLKAQNLGYNPENLGLIGFEFFTDKLHPDDYDRVMDNMRKHLRGETPAYEVEYRIQHRKGHYIWYYDRGVVVERDESGKPVFLQGIVFDISEAKATENKLKFFAEKDALTQTYNRRILYAELQKHIQLFESDNITFSLLMVDIDYFKQINDTHGHLVGDDVLIAFTKLINDEKRLDDMLFRYGGDEFFLLLPNTNLDGAIKFGKRLHQSIRKSKMPKIDNFTVSMGLVEYKPLETADDVIKRTDDLMYKAKKSGRNQFKF